MENLNAATSNVYEMRFPNNWDGPDTIFDAWLLLNIKIRVLFDHHLFLSLHPDWGTLRQQFFGNKVEKEIATKKETMSKRNLSASSLKITNRRKALRIVSSDEEDEGNDRIEQQNLEGDRATSSSEIESVTEKVLNS